MLQIINRIKIFNLKVINVLFVYKCRLTDYLIANYINFFVLTLQNTNTIYNCLKKQFQVAYYF